MRLIQSKIGNAGSTPDTWACSHQHEVEPGAEMRRVGTMLTVVEGDQKRNI